MILVTLIIMMAASSSQKERVPVETTKGGKMSGGEVAERVKRKDWTVLDQKGTVGRDAGPALLPLVNDKDPQVRELAVTCLHESGGSSARQGLLQALHDRTDTVRASAARFLRDLYTPEDLPAIRSELGSSKDEFVREQLSLLAGEAGDQASTGLLHERVARDPDAHARHAASIALARLGDAEGRRELIGRLQQGEPKQLAAALRDLPYVNDRGLLVNVRTLLDNTQEAVNAGPSHGPYMIRVCDVAVNVVNEMMGRPFPWVQPVKRYSPQELSQVKQLLAGIP
jgi:hypothetical protein